ncbi:MAG: hypothetical protein ACRD3E_09300 [Terriglobales bacterium]
MPRWTPQKRLTKEAFLGLLDAHLFVSMDVDGDGHSVMVCSCGVRLRCARISNPERVYREHLAEYIERMVKAAMQTGTGRDAY